MVFAIASAKAIAESSYTRDFWANTRITNNDEVHAFGRVPEEDSSWRKPVKTLPSPQEIPQQDINIKKYYDLEKLQKLFKRYMPLWEKLAQKISLFPEGVNGKEQPYSEKTHEIIWSNGRFEVQLFRRGHLNGYHLMVSPVGQLKENFERQWQTIIETGEEQMIQEYIQATLEATAIAYAIRSLVNEGKGEIHNSGNWAKGLKPKEEGGALSLENLRKNRKKEKRRHFTRIKIGKDGRLEIVKEPEESFGTSMHVHVYIPLEGEEVVLPEMSKEEALQRGRNDIVAQWDNIKPLTDEQIKDVIDKLHGEKLNQYLEDHFKGNLL